MRNTIIGLYDDFEDDLGVGWAYPLLPLRKQPFSANASTVGITALSNKIRWRLVAGATDPKLKNRPEAPLARWTLIDQRKCPIGKAECRHLVVVEVGIRAIRIPRPPDRCPLPESRLSIAADVPPYGLGGHDADAGHVATGTRHHDQRSRRCGLPAVHG